MSHNVRIAISRADSPGLLSAVTARLFDLGGDLGDASFAVLGKQAELTCICGLPDHVSAGEAHQALQELPGLANAHVQVQPFSREAVHAPQNRVTHRVVVRGADQPGLVAGLTEGFAEHGANIVRMDAERLDPPGTGEYSARFEVWVAPDRAEACLASAANVAESYGLTFHVQPL